MVVWGARVVFAATTAAAGSEPWITDGTTAGTFQLGDLAGGATGSTPSQFTVAGNAVTRIP